MKYYSTRFVPCIAMFGLAVLCSCGDENYYDASATVGMDIIAKGDNMPSCGPE